MTTLESDMPDETLSAAIEPRPRARGRRRRPGRRRLLAAVSGAALVGSLLTVLPAVAASAAEPVAHYPFNSTTVRSDVLHPSESIPGDAGTYLATHVDLGARPHNDHIAGNTPASAKVTGSTLSLSLDFMLPSVQPRATTPNSALLIYGGRTDYAQNSIMVHPFYAAGTYAVVVYQNGAAAKTLQFAAPAFDVWHNIVVTLDGRAGGYLSAYVDGALAGRIAADGLGADAVGNQSIRIGRDKSPINIAGSYRDLYVFPQILTGEEAAGYAAANAPFAFDALTARLGLVDGSDVTRDLALPTGTGISWTVPAGQTALTADGRVTRPAAGEAAASVSLTLGSRGLTTTYRFTVPSRLDPQDPPAAIDDVALTPPMGWNSWNAFGCSIDETKIRAAADAMVASGMKDAGYEYVVVDDCWQAPTRSAQGALRADPTRFPSGMKALGDYIHGLGLKFGIYQAPRAKTCAQYFGSTTGATGAQGYEEQDADTFASWGVDYLKYDWCSNEGTIDDEIAAFTLMRDALRATGRPIVYSINPNSIRPNWGAEHDFGDIAHMWRTTEDITAKWTSGCTADCFMGVTEILDVQANLTAWNGPGHWNDPDMLEVGNGTGLNATEARAHFGMWALMAAPLIAGNNIATMNADIRSLLTNRDVIAVDQDPDGVQASRIRDDGDLEIWRKPLSDGSVAVGLLNRGAGEAVISTTAAEIGLAPAGGYDLEELLSGVASDSTGSISASVPSHGLALFRVAAKSIAPTVSAAATTRCVAGKVQVVVTATNSGAETTSVRLSGDFGSKLLGIAPGKSMSASFASRQSDVTAGAVTYEASSGGVSQSGSAGYAASACG